MAFVWITRIIISILFLLALFAPGQAKHLKLKQAKFSVYNHVFEGGHNPTLVGVAGVEGKPINFTNFGSILVGDDKATEGTDFSSPEACRNQGIFAVSSLDGSYVHIMTAMVFTNKEYGGSTLLLKGAFGKEKELAIIGGTGKFRYARGYILDEVLCKVQYYTRERVDVNVMYYEEIDDGKLGITVDPMPQTLIM